MNDDLSILASAYLDDEVTAHERALIEADPATMAEVDRLGAVRALLADAEPPAISMREAHLAAALSAWDRLPDSERMGIRRDATPTGVDGAAVAGAAAVTAPTRLDERRAARTNRWLLGAAAALVVVLVGGVAAQLNRGGVDDSTSSDAGGGTLDAAPFDATEIAPGAPTPAAELSRELDDALTAADAADGDDGDSSGTIATGIDLEAPPAEEPQVVLRDTADLADFAAAARNVAPIPDGPVTTGAPSDEEAVGDDLAPGPPICFGVDLIVGYAQFVDRPVIVGVVTARDLAIAYEVDGCVEVARVQMP